MIGFSVDENDIIISLNIRMSIPEFLQRITEVYKYAIDYNVTTTKETESLTHQK